MVALAHKKYVSQFAMMGTVISLTLFDNKPALVERVYDYLQTMTNVLSANDEHSTLGRINQQAGIAPVAVDATTFAFIQRALAATRQYQDSFNVLIGPLVKLWKIGFGGQTVPAKSAIATSLQRMNPDDVVLDATRHTVFLTKRGMQLDLGAIAKGYFADRVKAQLQAAGVTSGIIDLGGNVQTWGDNPLTPDGRWHIGIQDPDEARGEALLTVVTPAQSFVTSGVRERYFQRNGRTYHHILDPQTGYPVRNDLLQVTIMTENSELAEVLSTVSFFKGPQAGQTLIEQLPGVDAIFVRDNGAVELTSGLAPQTKGVYQNVR
ncbi:FAD:protein FMN transferase [Levilactobacillus acidifarinae]|nr:FAD:protein FMN transferase [Levilactobacillus acidifarinae]GEO69130.1 FAD:protein FMN transferase [Levilactobacillus acidifarinae]